jgi:regulator of CtrA degradation
MIELGPKTVTGERAGVVRDFATSELFDRTFSDGMELVEDAAAYLDGPGRQDSKLLSRNAALAYAGESMRLTTRLMQVASWLLVQRAVREGDMSPEDACQDRYRVSPNKVEAEAAPDPLAGLKTETAAALDPLIAELPNGLMELVQRSERLFERVSHLDRRMYLEPQQDDAEHPVLSQHDRLRQAFGG